MNNTNETKKYMIRFQVNVYYVEIVNYTLYQFVNLDKNEFIYYCLFKV